MVAKGLSQGYAWMSRSCKKIVAKLWLKKGGKKDDE
jgi:hypothetical protein